MWAEMQKKYKTCDWRIENQKSYQFVYFIKYLFKSVMYENDTIWLRCNRHTQMKEKKALRPGLAHRTYPCIARFIFLSRSFFYIFVVVGCFVVSSSVLRTIYCWCYVSYIWHRYAWRISYANKYKSRKQSASQNKHYVNMYHYEGI